jgi:hypothetical protein
MLTYACPEWELQADSYLLKMQRLQNRALRTIGNLPRHTPIRDLHRSVKIPYLYDYVTQLCRKQVSVISNHENVVSTIGQGEAFKGKVVLCFNWAPCHEGVLGEWRYSSTHSLTSALDEGEWSASRLGRFTPKERAPDTHWIGGWVGPRTVLDAVVKGKIPSPCWESNPRTPIIQPVA